jgi:hypothetical protein
MGVDWQAFATAFLNGTALNIKERKDDADEYKDELTEKAEDNKALLSTRKSAAQAAYQHILTAKELGADDRTIKAALRAGPQGVQTLSMKLIQAKEAFQKEAPGVEWTPQDVSARAAVPELWEAESDDTTSAYYKKLADQLYGLGGGTAGDYKSKASRSWLENAMGFNAKDRIREELDIDTGAGGFSTYDLSKLDTTPSYTAGDFATVVTYTNPGIFGSNSVSNELKTLDSLRKVRIDEEGGFVKTKQDRIDILQKFIGASANMQGELLAKEGYTSENMPDMVEVKNTRLAEIRKIQKEIVDYKQGVYYQHFNTQIQNFPDDVAGRKLGYLINMDNTIKGRVSKAQYAQLRLLNGLEVTNGELSEAIDNAVTTHNNSTETEGTLVVTKNSNGEIIKVVRKPTKEINKLEEFSKKSALNNAGKIVETDDRRPEEKGTVLFYKPDIGTYVYGPGIANYEELKNTEEATFRFGEKLKEVIETQEQKDRSEEFVSGGIPQVASDKLVAFETKGTKVTIITDDTTIKFDMAVPKTKAASDPDNLFTDDGAFTDMLGNPAVVPVVMNMEKNGRTITHSNPTQVANLWEKSMQNILQLDKVSAQQAGLPYTVSEIIPYTEEIIKNLVTVNKSEIPKLDEEANFLQKLLFDIQLATAPIIFSENSVGKKSFLGGMTLAEGFGESTSIAGLSKKFPGSSIVPPKGYKPTTQSVTEIPIKKAALALRETSIAASMLENDELIDIMEFWKEIQRQNKDPDEREEFLRQYLQDNHSDLRTGELTIKPADVMPLFTEEYDAAAKPVIPRIKELFSMSASAGTNPALNTNITEDETVIAPSFQKPEEPGPDNAPIISDRQGLGAKPEVKTEVVEEGSTDPFVMEHIDDLVALAKGRKNVSSKKSLENIEKGRLGQWNTLIETWARKNDIELPEKIADRKALFVELADEYIRIMKSE